MIKKDVRKIYKQKRVDLSATERLKLDDLLLIQLQRLSFDDSVQLVMSFWPLENHGEMNMHLYTRYLEHAIPEIKIAFPVTDPSACKMHAILVSDETEFVENKYGITEPAEGEEIEPQDIDLVFVPLLAFDKKGYRVGYGKGYYDRFLEQCREDVITVGFSYFEAIDKIDDTHQFDVPLNYCITPHKIYEF
ncbi:5-formyltetrahydrofolate cyclo-ligase [Segetibacter koreensis]|uniref:5-formyltetrahydrofolate cyclo-ligase n=1 Tax=Segetibacter koreensis TaxID=398037 RepID=UPI000371DD34|nr:5-formyltetrahydrofolate cyclo-ligase [Segetibacter koreensis]